MGLIKPTALFRKATVAVENDPLTGLPFFSRWQTRIPGSNALLGNLYQDSGLTIPAISVSDPIGGFRSVFGVTATMIQATGGSRAALAFDGSIPYANFNGSAFLDMPDMSGLSEGEIFILYQNTTATTGQSGNSLYSMAADAGSDRTSFIPYSEIPNDIYDSFGSMTRQHAGIGAFNVGWNVYNASSKNGEWRCGLNGTEIFSTGVNIAGFASAPILAKMSTGTIWPGGRIIALFIFSTVLTTPQRAIINTYLNNLII